MPIALTDDEKAALRRGSIAIRTLIDFHFDSGRYSFWDGEFHWEAEPGVTYLAVSDFGEVSSVGMGQDLGAEGITLRLNGTKLIEASPDADDPGAFFGMIEEENYQQRRTDVRFAFFDIDTGALLFTKRRYAGLVDQMRQLEEINEQFTAAEQWLVIALESMARRYMVRSGRTRSHEDQREIDATDDFFKFTAPSVAKQGNIWWGRRPPGSGGGILDHASNILRPRSVD